MDNKPQEQEKGGADNRVPDIELVKASKKGDKTAFEELINRYYKAVFGYIYLRVNSHHAAEEMTQETFLRGYRSLRKLSAGTGFAEWIFTIARNCYSEWVRDSQRMAKHKTESMESAKATDPAQESKADSAEKEKLENLMNQMKELPESYYLILTMRYQQEMSCDEIARTLDQPVGTVTSNLARAYKLLKDGLKYE
ncbi:MAG: sigma-70 family RNA polymerase sigma factor [Planctomycetota bacterium]